LRAKLKHDFRREGKFRTLWEFYQELIRLRKMLTPLARLSKDHCEVSGFDDERVLLLRRWNEGEQVVVTFNFNHSHVSVSLPLPAGRWRKVLDSTDPRWEGPGGALPEQLDIDGNITLALPAKSLAVFARGEPR
jgi:maltooligosyltrehalose trehalohydrolase